LVQPYNHFFYCHLSTNLNTSYVLVQPVAGDDHVSK